MAAHAIVGRKEMTQDSGPIDVASVRRPPVSLSRRSPFVDLPERTYRSRIL